MIRIFIAMLFAFSFMGSIGAAAQTPPETPQAASDADAAKVTKTVTTWLKRAGSKNPEVRQRAWDGTTEEFKQFYFAGDPNAFSFERSKVYSTGDVTISENDRFNVNVTLSGLINEHRLYHIQFVLTRDLLIDDYVSLPDIRVPDELESTTIRIQMTDDSLKVDHPDFATNEAIVLIVKNEGSTFHFLQVFRVKDGQTVDILAQSLLSASPTEDIATSYGLAAVLAGNETTAIGLVNVEPGEYVIAGLSTDETLRGIYASFTISK